MPKKVRVLVEYLFELPVEHDQLRNGAAIHDYRDNLSYIDGCGEYYGPGRELVPERKVVSVEGL